MSSFVPVCARAQTRQAVIFFLLTLEPACGKEQIGKKQAQVLAANQGRLRMALNPPLLPGAALPLPVAGETFVLHRRGIQLDAEVLGMRKYQHKGDLFLSTLRMVFVRDARASTGWFGLGGEAPSDLVAYDLPLSLVRSERFNQPIFGCNNVEGVCLPLPGTPADTHFRLSFYEGGVGTFLPLFFDLLNRNRHGPVHAPAGLDTGFASALASGRFMQVALRLPPPASVLGSSVCGRGVLFSPTPLPPTNTRTRTGRLHRPQRPDNAISPKRAASAGAGQLPHARGVLPPRFPPNPCFSPLPETLNSPHPPAHPHRHTHTHMHASTHTNKQAPRPTPATHTPATHTPARTQGRTQHRPLPPHLLHPQSPDNPSLSQPPPHRSHRCACVHMCAYACTYPGVYVCV